jgi:hypothetical protein
LTRKWEGNPETNHFLYKLSDYFINKFLVRMHTQFSNQDNTFSANGCYATNTHQNGCIRRGTEMAQTNHRDQLGTKTKGKKRKGRKKEN